MLVACPATGASVPQNRSLQELVSLSLEDLANVVVSTPSKNAQRLPEAPATVRVITAQDLRDRGCLTLEEALADLPGIQFRNLVGFNGYAFFRGVPNQNNHVLLMIDGVQVNELNSGGFYLGGQYNLANVERIEVVYGPASSMYGTNAVGGVINLITRDPQDTPGLRVSTLFGGFDTRRQDFTWRSHDAEQDLGISLSGMLKSGDKADLRGSRGDGNWSGSLDTSEQDAALDAKIRCRRVTVGLNLLDKEASYATKDRSTGTALQDFDVPWHIRFLNTWARYDFRRADRWSWSSTAYYRDTTVEDDTRPVISRPTATDPGYRERWFRPNHLVGLENRYDGTLGPHLSLNLGHVRETETLAAGFARSRSAAWSVEPEAPARPDMLTNDLTSLYAQLTWHLSEPLRLTVGSRYDDSDVYGTVNTPRLGLVYNRGRCNAKLLYAEAYRAPKPWDFRDGLGNPDLAPETMRSSELAVGYRFAENLRAEISLYRNVLANCLTRENSAAGWRWVNLGKVRTTGCEGTLEYRRGKGRSYLNLTYTDADDSTGRAVPEIALHTANAGCQYAFTDRVKFDLRGQYLGRRRNPPTTAAGGDPEIDDAFVMNGTLSLADVAGCDVQIAGRNLLDAKYFHTSNTTVSRYRQPQRSVSLEIARRF